MLLFVAGEQRQIFLQGPFLAGFSVHSQASVHRYKGKCSAIIGIGDSVKRSIGNTSLFVSRPNYQCTIYFCGRWELNLEISIASTVIFRYKDILRTAV